MRINSSGTTYTEKTRAHPRQIQVMLDINDFGMGGTVINNSYPGPGFFSPDLQDTVNPNPTYAGYVAEVDLSTEMSRVNLEDLQSVFIDNSVNPGYLMLVNKQTQHQIMIAPFSQGVFPLFTIPGTKTFQWDVVSCDRTNWPFGGVSWWEQSLASLGVGPAGIIARDAFLTLIFTDATAPIGQWSYTSKGGIWYYCGNNLTLANTWETPALVTGTETKGLNKDAYRRGWKIYNPHTETEPLHIAYHRPGTGNGIMETLYPGESYQEVGDDAYTGTVQVVAATTGHAYGASVLI
jgi:hypothetical protein